jgi:hypothetical protein
MDPKKDDGDGDEKDVRREEEEGDDETADAEETERESSEPPPPKSESKSSKSSGSKARVSDKAKREGRPAKDARKPVSAAAPAKNSSQAVVIAIVALAAGGAVGWFGHQARAKAQIKAESAPAAAGSSGPCGQWQEKICADTGGQQSAACQQAKAAGELLTPGTCENALAAMPATLEKIKAGRVHCDNLVNKLCADLPKDSPACAMVKERTPSFPSDRCKGMLDQYDQVLAQLKMLDSQGGGMMGRPPGGMPHGGPPGAAPPHGGPPGGAAPPPPGSPPQGSPHP